MDKLVYSPEEYDALECNDYRVRFPIETVLLSDRRLFEIMAEQDDDRDDAEWRQLFIAG
jgi:hypothetical protein